MKLIVDTHTALWWLGDDARLGPEAVRQLSDDTNLTHLSAAVVWEVAITRSLGRLEAPMDSPHFCSEQEPVRSR